MVFYIIMVTFLITFYEQVDKNCHDPNLLSIH